MKNGRIRQEEEEQEKEEKEEGKGKRQQAWRHRGGGRARKGKERRRMGHRPGGRQPGSQRFTEAGDQEKRWGLSQARSLGSWAWNGGENSTWNCPAQPRAGAEPEAASEARVNAGH